jgi:tetraacyldisaccharide 4'-kinase
MRRMIIWWDQICGASFFSWRFPIKCTLILLTYIYRLFFAFKKGRTLISFQKSIYLPVLSVGNLSVGGTGKSVITRFIVRHFSRPCAGILLRGYGRDIQGGDPTVVSWGNGLCVDPRVAGDEAAMYAEALQVPVVVGRSRAAAAELLLSQPQHQISYVLLDDGYQHFSLRKSFEILLLDARFPFENGWCLPAGRLREYDLSRAHAIILTHADYLSAAELAKVKELVVPKTKNFIPVFAGKHLVTGVRFWGMSGAWETGVLRNMYAGAVAAIGSFDQFVSSIKEVGGQVQAQFSFPDHHRYSVENLNKVLVEATQKGCTVLVTTTKDWSKILPLLHLLEKGPHLTWAVLDIEFAFLTAAEHAQFFKLLEHACQRVHRQKSHRS